MSDLAIEPVAPPEPVVVEPAALSSLAMRYSQPEPAAPAEPDPARQAVIEERAQARAEEIVDAQLAEYLNALPPHVLDALEEYAQQQTYEQQQDALAQDTYEQIVADAEEQASADVEARRAAEVAARERIVELAAGRDVRPEDALALATRWFNEAGGGDEQFFDQALTHAVEAIAETGRAQSDTFAQIDAEATLLGLQLSPLEATQVYRAAEQLLPLVAHRYEDRADAARAAVRDAIRTMTGGQTTTTSPRQITAYYVREAARLSSEDKSGFAERQKRFDDAAAKGIRSPKALIADRAKALNAPALRKAEQQAEWKRLHPNTPMPSSGVRS